MKTRVYKETPQLEPKHSFVFDCTDTAASTLQAVSCLQPLVSQSKFLFSVFFKLLSSVLFCEVIIQKVVSRFYGMFSVIYILNLNDYVRVISSVQG